MSQHRIFYAAGPGNIIAAHNHWKNGEHDPSEVSITFSSQIEDYCARTGTPAYFISYRSPAEIRGDDLYKTSPIDTHFITLEHRPKRDARGLLFHIEAVRYCLGLLWTAKSFGATIAIVDSGTFPFWMGRLFRLAGIPVIVVLHNTIWPKGFPPEGRVKRFLSTLDATFFRAGASASIGVSPECTRQVDQITNGIHGPLYQIRAQFLPERFSHIPPPPPFDGSELRVMFIGRVDRIKGVLDILEIAKRLEQTRYGKVRWTICGTGPDADHLKQRRDAMGLDNVHIAGWVSMQQLQQIYGDSHVSIVPTRSSFAEGLAMTAAEAILAGRPIITNPVVPALEILKPACIEARTDDADSYVQAISDLLDRPAKYTELCAACGPLQHQFYDRENGLDAILGKAIDDLQTGNGRHQSEQSTRPLQSH